MNLSCSRLFQAVSTWLVLIVLFTGCEPVDSDSHHDDSHSHEHAHDHGHQHGEPILGGQMVEVGHAHNPNGLLFYFAEILPGQDDSIRFYLSVEDEAGTSKPAVSKEPEILAYFTDEEHLGGAAREVYFKYLEESEEISVPIFSASLPTEFEVGGSFSVVIPKMTLGGERMSFSFKFKSSSAPDSGASSQSGAPSSEESGDEKLTDGNAK